MHVDELDGMDGRHGEGRRLLISVVQFVEIFVEERRVVHAVVPIRQVILLFNWKIVELPLIRICLDVRINTCQMKMAGYWRTPQM